MANEKKTGTVSSTPIPVEIEKTVPGAILKPTVQKWEYLCRMIGGEPDLGPFGAEGWELVYVSEHGFNEHVFYFRRPKV